MPASDAVNCTGARLSLGAEPRAMTDELAQHLRECVTCAQYRRELLQLDEKIRRALNFPDAESS